MGPSAAMKRKNGVALWRQIADRIRGEIAAGDHDETGMLPPEMALAEKFGVNRHTVRSAIAALASEGILEPVQGRGTMIARKERLSFPISRRTRFTEGIGDQDALLALPDQLWRVWLALAEAGAIGFAFATLARSPLAGVGAGIALYFIESFAALLLPDVVRWLPFSAAAAVISGADTSGLQGGVGGEPLEPTTALVVVLVWLLGALAVAAVSAERAEITG